MGDSKLGESGIYPQEGYGTSEWWKRRIVVKCNSHVDNLFIDRGEKLKFPGFFALKCISFLEC